MTAALPKAERTRLAKLLALASSDFPGERENAVIAACRLVKSRGLTWQQVLDPPPPERPLPKLRTWRSTVRACLERPGSLRPWEKTFLSDLPNLWRLSVKQRYVLKEIADRVLGRAP